MKKITLISLMLAGPVYAHVPYVESLDYQDEESFLIKAPIEKTLALYNHFDNPSDFDRAVFDMTDQDFKDAKAVLDAEGQPARKVTLSTIVPACAPYADILPTLLLIGPRQSALPAPTAEVPVPLKADQGVFQVINTEQGAVFSEDVSGTKYFQQRTVSFLVTVPGRYEVIVYEPQGKIADYVLVVGDEEIFSPSDIVQSLKRIQYIREGNEIRDETCRAELKS